MAFRHSLPIWRIALFVFVVACIFWLGSVNIRAVIGNDMLKIGTLEFEEYMAPEAEREIFRLLSITSIVVMASYGIALMSSIVFLATCPFRLRENGWLMMSAILFYLFVPVEIFTMVLDGKMMYQEFFTTAENEVFREIFVARAAALSGAPLLATMCYYTIIGLTIFQPFKKKYTDPHEI